MKCLTLWIWACVSWTSAHAEATIERLTLLNAQNPGVIWTTQPRTSQWILGVSDQAAGPLLNAADSSITGLPLGNYWLFADPADIGTYAVLGVGLSDGSRLTALFQVSGSNGTPQAWQRLAGSSQLALGWADGVIDLVGRTDGTRPNRINDLYLYATLGAPALAAAPVPEPGQGALLLLGLAAGAGMVVVKSRRAALPHPN